MRKTVDALKEIRKQIQPFLRVIESSDASGDNDDDTSSSRKHDAHTVAEARTAVALAVGTLRHMGARLGGRGGGGSGDKNDPLRLELERMRKMLVTLRKVDTRGDTNDAKKKPASGKTNGENTEQVAKRTDDETEGIKSASKEDQKRKKRDGDESWKKKRRKIN